MLAGLSVKSIIDEPTAAAIGYKLEKVPRQEERHVFVFDLGHFSLDVSFLIFREDGTIEVMDS